MDLNRPTLGFVLHELSRTIRRRMDQRASALGLTRAQWWVLTHLSRREGCKQAEMAEAMEIEPITLARHIDRLAGQNLVERRACPDDRRAWRLYFTPQGRALLEQLQAIGAEIREEAMAGLPQEERDRLIETLLFIKSNLSRVMNGPEETSHG